MLLDSGNIPCQGGMCAESAHIPAIAHTIGTGGGSKNEQIDRFDPPFHMCDGV